jgi:hypothetical protein
VVREFRHFTAQAETTTDKRCVALTIVSGRCKEFFDKLDPDVCHTKPISFEEMNISISDIYDGFINYEWDRYYGGQLWGKATKFLLDNPKTIKAKELWVDQVLDLHNNCGHLLNKTKYRILSKRGQFHNNKNKRSRRTALNYRRYTTTLSDLAIHASPKVRKLVTANLNMVPVMIR